MGLPQKRGRTSIDIFNAFKLAGVAQKFDIAMRRMTHEKIDASDEGYESLMDDPPSIDTIQAYLQEVFSQVQVQLAQQKIDGAQRPRG